MPAYMKIEGIDGEYRAVEWKELGSQDLTSITNEIRSKVPYRQAQKVIVQPSSKPQWAIVTDSRGIIAILIGLLLPAVQRLQQQPGATTPLQSLLATGGKVICDGSV